jgi:ubiquinone/menaquinone biosynthesis C-methylase UbiE
MKPFFEATYLAEQRHFWFQGLERFSTPLIERALAGRARPLILDCGFGTGANMARLARYGEVTGFDVSMGGVEYARLYGQHRLARASITAVPFSSSTFDLVTAFDVLACLEEDEIGAALAEVWRVLKPGGAFLLNTAALGILRGSHAVFGQEVHRASRRSLRRMLERQRFRVDRLTYTNCSLFPLMIVVRASQRVFGLSSPEESGVDIVVPPRWVNEPLSAALALEARALRFVNMPLGSSLLGLAIKPAEGSR